MSIARPLADVAGKPIGLGEALARRRVQRCRAALVVWTILLLLAAYPACSAVVWSDEFNGDVVDTETWIHDVASWGFGNGQFEYDTARPENAYLADGNLVIEARREDYFGKKFTSARMLSQGRFAFKYGTLEARIKVPDTENGLWPAFWLLGNNFPGIGWPGCGEVDIMEIGSSAGIVEGLQQEKINCALHYSNAGDAYASVAAWTNASVDLSLDYHLYTMAWTPSNMTFYLDGTPYGSWDITPDHLAEFHQPMFIVLNLAVGGWNPSYTGVYSPEEVTAAFPARMYVDWIRLTDNGHTELLFGDDVEQRGHFGVFTETTPVEDALIYGDGSDPAFPYGTSAALFVWNNLTAVPPASVSEGTEAASFDIAGGDWFGLGVFLPNFRNMRSYSDGLLHFDIKTTSPVAMRVGVKSSRGGESWLDLGDETSEFGFQRDGAWHTVILPLNRFQNTDFQTIHQVFMIAGDPPPSGTNLSIDDVWWESSGSRPRPEQGNFGVFTETVAHRDAGQFEPGSDGDFFIWGDTMVAGTQNPFEGSESISLESAAGFGWFGAAFTPTVKYDLSAFRLPDSKLRFSMKTRSSTTFMIGMRSGNVIGPDSPWGPNTGPAGVGQKWITFAPGSDPYGFARDGAWHLVEIPMSEFATEIDLFEVSQLFQVLGVDGPISGIEFDDIHFSGGGEARERTSLDITPGGTGIDVSFLSDHLTHYRVLCKDVMSSPRWTGWRTVAGDGTVKMVSEPTPQAHGFYSVETIR